ncbi:MAG: hypothetical protein U0163_10015 [Gemmatimonadaceae bacterium]
MRRLLTILVLAVGCNDRTSTGAVETPASAIITFAFAGYPADTIRVAFRDAPSIAQATNYLTRKTGPRFPIGPIVRGAGVDARYPFHFDADSVKLAEVAIELCDGRLMRTMAELDAFMRGATGDANAPRAVWCPWNAYPVKVESGT